MKKGRSARRRAGRWQAVRRAIAILLGGAFVVASCLPFRQPMGDVQAELRREIKRRPPVRHRAAVDAGDLHPLVLKFYAKRNYRPAWTDGRRATGDARQLLEAIAAAPRDGLDPAVYRLARLDSLVKEIEPGTLSPSPEARALAALDMQLTRTFFVYASHLALGQVEPAALSADWHVKREKLDLPSSLEGALDRGDVARALQRLAPRDARYLRLRGALERYRQLAAAGWGSIPPGARLKRGSRGARVAALRARLAASGDLDHFRAQGRIFDAATEEGLRRFERRHGLEPDGVLSDQDLRALDVPIMRRIRQLELNLERWRWVPSKLGNDYIMVNIPAFELELWGGGRPTFASRVVVGKQWTPTPMFSDEVTAVVINPYWNVPPTIAGTEIAAAVREDPTYLAQHAMRVFETSGNTTREVDPRSVHWGDVMGENRTYSFRQDPGPLNPIGHVKFLCPNPFDIYLHDTPAGHLFDATERGFSHGCIRVERSLELAERLLKGAPGSSKAELEAACASAALDSVVKLPHRMPVHLFYWTAWVDDRGVVQFRDDLYGLDAALERALGREIVRARPDA